MDLKILSASSRLYITRISVLVRLNRSINTWVFDICKKKWKASIYLFKMGLPKTPLAYLIQTLFYPIYLSLQFNTFISRERISPIPLSSLLYLSSLKAVTFFHSFFPCYKNKQNIFRIVLQRLGKCSANSRSFYYKLWKQPSPISGMENLHCQP